jgi:hypothetical protein
LGVQNLDFVLLISLFGGISQKSYSFEGNRPDFIGYYGKTIFEAALP